MCAWQTHQKLCWEEKNDITSFFLHIFLKLHISLSTFSKARCGLTFCFNGNLRKSQVNQPTCNQHRALECRKLRTHNPWSRVLLDKLTASQLVKKFPAFYWPRIFITAFTSTHHLSLSLASSNQSMPPHPTSWRSILILFSHLRLGLTNGLFPSGFPTKTLNASPLLHMRYTPRPSHSSLFYHP